MPIAPLEVPRQTWQRFWPHEFTQQRQYNRPEENKSYLEWINNWVYDSDRSGFENGGEESEDEDEDEEEDGDRDGVIDDEQQKIGVNENATNQEQKVDKSDGCNGKVRTFMAGAGWDDLYMQHDQVELVAGFCEHAPSEDAAPVALIDDRNSVSNARVDCSRPYLGPLTPEQLRDELGKQVIRSIRVACSSLTV